MFIRLLMLFTIVPLVELYLLIKIGEKIGTINTIGIVVLTGILGASFAKSQGRMAILRIKETFAQGQVPGREVLHGIMILAGGIMLVTPGILTDVFGLSLIFPWTRDFYIAFALSYIDKKIQSNQWQFSSQTIIHTNVIDGTEEDEE